MQRTFIRPFTDKERRSASEMLTFLETQSVQQSNVFLEYRFTLGAICGAFVGVFVLLLFGLTDKLPPMGCVYLLLGFAIGGVFLHPLFQKWQTIHNYSGQIEHWKRVRDSGQRRVLLVDAIEFTALRYANAEESHDYEVFFCDLGDGTVLCVHGDVVSEAVEQEEFPCLHFELLGYLDSETFDVLVARSEPVEPAFVFDWEELGNAYIPKDGEILTGISLATLPDDLRRLKNRR